MSKEWKCEDCDLFDDGYCTKFKLTGKCELGSREWLESEGEFIPIEKMCRESSMFGNYYIGLTKNDIERIQKGEVKHMPGEYGLFIGFIDEDGLDD